VRRNVEGGEGRGGGGGGGKGSPYRLCSRWGSRLRRILRSIFSMAWHAERARVLWSVQGNERLSVGCGEPSVCVFDVHSEHILSYSLIYFLVTLS